LNAAKLVKLNHKLKEIFLIIVNQWNKVTRGIMFILTL